MKPSFKLTLTLLLAFFTTQLFAQKEDKDERERYENFKEKSISKTYPASGNALNIDNTFGKVVVNTWTKNEIKVDIHIEASATEKETMERIFNNIEVTDRQEGSKIYFKTTMDNERRNKDGGKNE